jgi:protein-S-isoprenylcysteine O-methyltransferase Ste14
MNAYRISPIKYPWPAIFYLVALVIALALNHAVPLHIADGQTLSMRLAGVVIGFSGAFLVVWASVLLFRNRAALMASRAAARLVVAGPFRFSRNPIYLGYTLLVGGYGLGADNAWILTTALVAAASTHLYVIRKEEMHLLARFGYEFERYCRRTRAWI